MRCQQSGCPGRIVDGYCDICGLPGEVAPSVSIQNVPAWRLDEAPSTTELGLGYAFVDPGPPLDPTQATIDVSKFDPPPPLNRGDIVGGQYEVVGCLAKGGMGWIYLARDDNVSGRWVVLKAITESDEDARISAHVERTYLAQVAHPGVVEIYNVVQQGESSFIVMEYVGGRSLAQYQREMTERTGSPAIPYDDALAFLIAVAGPLQHLHDLGLVYCDIKPANVIQVGDGIKLIDLGSVRHRDDGSSPIFGTEFYQAPELASTGPTVATDIYALGKTLLELTNGQTAAPLVVGAVSSLISRCCAPNPASRFTSMRQLRQQAIGVLRLISGKLHPDEQRLFSSPGPLSFAVTAAALPQAIGGENGWGDVYRNGLAAFDAGAHADAERLFLEVVDFLPGEIAPRLALAFAQIATLSASAAESFESLSLLGYPYRVPALIGLALARRALGDIPGALEAMSRFEGTELVVQSASYYRTLWRIESATIATEVNVPIPPDLPLEWRIQLAIAAQERLLLLQPRDRAARKRLDYLLDQQRTIESFGW